MTACRFTQWAIMPIAFRIYNLAKEYLLPLHLVMPSVQMLIATSLFHFISSVCYCRSGYLISFNISGKAVDISASLPRAYLFHAFIPRAAAFLLLLCLWTSPQVYELYYRITSEKYRAPWHDMRLTHILPGRDACRPYAHYYFITLWGSFLY